MNESMRQLAENYADLRAIREDLEAKAKAAKICEKEAEVRLIYKMAEEGCSSQKFEGIGTLVRRDYQRYEIADIELLARQMCLNMVKALREGRPLAGELLLQRRVGKEVMDGILGEIPEDPNADLASSYGVRRMTDVGLTFTRQKTITVEE